jgi:CRISPR/Cas system-associated exonuclease Cas4 (RecB family)
LLITNQPPKQGRIERLGDSPWEKQYERQLGVYRWLLEQNGFAVETVGYLVYANASKEEPKFGNELKFETTLVAVTTSIDWIEGTLEDIKKCLEQKDLPKSGETCEFCPYREASGKKLQAVHFAKK